jgi:hypothetical protein
MKNLLYLYNNGYRAFPQLGKGGLGYKPPFKIIGESIHMDEGQTYYVDDNDPYGLYDHNNSTRTDINPGDIMIGPSGLEYKGDKVADKYNPYDEDDDVDYSKVQFRNDDEEEEFEEDADDIDYDIIPDNEFNTITTILDFKRPSTKINKLKELKDTEIHPETTKYIELLLSELEIEQEAKESKKDVEAYEVPDIEALPEITEDEKEEIINYQLEELEGYDDVINDINDSGDDFSSLAIDTLEGYGDNYYNNFSIPGGGGVDFEDKVKDFPEFFEEVLKEVGYPTDIKVVEIIPDGTNYDKADFVIKTNKGEFINIEMKKQVATTKKYREYNSTESFNYNDKKLFDEWFIVYKRKLMDANKDAKDGDDDEYKVLLNAISTNGKIDKSKLRMLYIESGQYFGSPLTTTKFETLSEEELMKIYGNEAIVKYQTHGKRINISKNKLIPVILTRDAILVMDVRDKLQGIAPQKILKLGLNLYSKKTKNALLMPSCLYSVLKLPDALVKSISKVKVVKKDTLVKSISKVKVVKKEKKKK